MKKDKKITGGNYLAFGLYAFLGLGMEVVILGVEQVFYANSMNEMTTVQNIIHWILTSIVWGGFVVGLSRYSKQNYQFNIIGERQRLPMMNWVLALSIAALCIASNAWSWGTLKLIGEFTKKGLLLFVFQYIYYLFETLLVLSVIVYGQKAGEMWFRKSKIPWGGLLVGLTWGLVHALTKGSLFVGLEAMLSGILYGCIYLLMGKYSVYAYILIFLAFTL